MRGMNSATFDLIYLDPPFNSKANYAAPIGSVAAGAAFTDTWTLSDLDIEWLDLIESQHPALHRIVMAAMRDSDKSYLVYMAARLLEMRRLLKPTGSIYLHCDPTMSHYLKLVMDAVFGQTNFRNEIVWCYTGPSNTKKWFPRKHDIIFVYTAGNQWTFNWKDVRVPYVKLKTGKTSGIIFKQAATLNPAGKVPEDWWSKFTPVGRIKYERTGYPTQKPLALLNRIIKASSNEGDIVLDPFCGCATTCVASDKLDRKWVGIDIAEKAYELVNIRLRETQGAVYHSDGTQRSILEEVIHRTDIPQRTDLGDIPRYNCTENKTFLYGQQGGHCGHCRTHFQIQHLQVDHIIARNKGGTDHLSNLQLLCGYCNSVKGDRGMEYLRQRLCLAA